MTTAHDKPSYHHGNLRVALLEAVGEIIRENGVGAVSLREAARRAGVSHSAPSHHFGDKLGMLTAFAIQGFEEFRRRMEGAIEAASGDAREAFNAIGVVYIEFSIREPEWFDVMFRSEMHDKDDPALREAARRAFGVLTEAVETLCAASDDDLDAEMIAIDAWAKVHGLATLWRDGALQMFVDQPLPDLVQQLFETDPLPKA